MNTVFVYHHDATKLQCIKRVINDYYIQTDRAMPLEITVFADHAHAMSWLRQHSERVDMLFIDCSDQRQAAQLVKAVRISNLRASWVYMDNTTEQLCAALMLRPSVYIRDTSDIMLLQTTIARLDRFHRTLEKTYDFIFKHEGDFVHIPFQRISYFESHAKKVTMYLRDRAQQYHFTAKLEDIQKVLPSHFLRCHQSYIVNLDEVRRLDTREKLFILTNNEDVVISRRHYSDAKEHYERYLEEKKDAGWN